MYGSITTSAGCLDMHACDLLGLLMALKDTRYAFLEGTYSCTPRCTGSDPVTSGKRLISQCHSYAVENESND
jgi:hypothetical protein